MLWDCSSTSVPSLIVIGSHKLVKGTAIIEGALKLRRDIFILGLMHVLIEIDGLSVLIRIFVLPVR